MAAQELFNIDFSKLFVIFTVLSAYHHDFAIATNSAGTILQPKFVDFPIYMLQQHIRKATHQPVCVIFRRNNEGYPIENVLYNVWNSSKSPMNLSEWEVGGFALDKAKNPPLALPQHAPTLRCYIGRRVPSDYSGQPDADNVTNWLSGLAAQHRDHLPEAEMSSLDGLLSQHTLSIIGVPGQQSHYDVEELLIQVQEDWGPAVSVSFVHPYSDDARELMSHFKIRHIPSVVLIENSASTKHTPTVQRVLVSTQVNRANIDIFMTLKTRPFKAYNTATFSEDLLQETKYYIPALLVFYSHWSPVLLDHLRALDRLRGRLVEDGVRLKYGVMEVNQHTRHVMESHVKFVYNTKMPFNVFFSAKWVKSTVVGAQTTLVPSRPSLDSLLTALRAARLHLNLTAGGRYNMDLPWGWYDQTQMTELYEGPDGLMCSDHSSNATDNNPRPKVKVIRRKRPSTKPKEVNWHEKFSTEGIDRTLEKLGTLSLVTDNTWQEVVEKSHAPLHPFNPGGKWKGERTKVTLVIFIMADCGNCRRNQDTFEDIQKAVHYIEGASIYVMNCTASALTCQAQGISGYPTIVAYRGLGWLLGHQCVRAEGHGGELLVRMDYHGVLQVGPVMEWFSRVNEQAVSSLMFDDLAPRQMSRPVSLLATLLPKHSPYLPRIPGQPWGDYFFPYECFRLACERLYGQAECYVRYSEEVPASEYTDMTQDMVVTQVSLVRKDGVRATVTQLGRPLSQTLDDEQNSGVHKFHTPHKYSLRTNQRCEDDHASCTQLLVSFTKDHGRLPVSHMTTEAFHARNSLIFDPARPVVMALVHGADVKPESFLYQTLVSVAYSLYSDVSMVTVDVDQFPGWAGQFVPRGGRHKFKEHYDGSVYTYPRLCVVMWHDHQHAAFYPPLKVKVTEPDDLDNDDLHLEDEFTDTEEESAEYFEKESILQYLRDYLEDPGRFIIETEHF